MGFFLGGGGGGGGCVCVLPVSKENRRLHCKIESKKEYCISSEICEIKIPPGSCQLFLKTYVSGFQSNIGSDYKLIYSDYTFWDG